MLLVLISTGEREEKDRDRSDDPEYPALPSRLYVELLASGILLIRELSLNRRSSSIDLKSSMSFRVTGFVPSWILSILRIAPEEG